MLFPIGNSSCIENALGERHQRYPALNHMCNQSKLTARRQVRVTSLPGGFKSMWGAAGGSSLSFSKALCVCQSRICSVSLFSIVCQRKIGNKKEPEKEKTRKQTYQRQIRAKVDHVTDCVFLPAHVISRAGIHTVYAMVWLGVKHAESALEGADCPHYEWLPLRMLRSRGGKLSLRRELSSASSQHLPRCRWGGAVAVLADRSDGGN